jgi:eukaryotic-like serine/threonine-protein kinase
MMLGRDDLPGQVVLEKHLVVGQIRDGSTGSVYLGRAERGAGDPVFVRAISPLYLKSSDATKEVQRELAKLVKLRDPRIASILAFGEEDGSYFVVSQYVDGYDLGHWASFVRQARGPFPVSIAIHVAVEVLRALDHAHTAAGPGGAPLGIVHRDLLPSNVVISRTGEVKLVDFGLARATMEGTAVIGGALAAKLAYLSPEQAVNATVGPPSDIYGVGLLLHELLTGQNEFAESSAPATLSAIMRKVARPVRELRSDVPADLSAAIARALDKKPAERFPSAAAFAEAIGELTEAKADGVASELAALVAADYADSGMAALKDVPTLADREKLLGSAAPPARPSKARPVARQPEEQRRRKRFSAAGEVVARPGARAAVWRAAPVRAKTAPIRRPRNWLLGGGILLALVLVAAAAILFALR